MTVIERLNARELEPADLPFAPGLATVDVSFISLTKVLPAVAACLAPGGEMLAMVKPQFELGRERVGRGVVRDAADRREAILAVAARRARARPAGARLRLLGPAGPEGQPRDLRLVRRARATRLADLEAAVAARSSRERAKTAALITHSHPPATTEAVAVARSRSPREAGWRLVATARGGRQARRRRRRASRSVEELPERPDLCLVLGGDGSILYALRRFARTGVPVFGVNFGTVGFLAAVERDEAERGDPPRLRRRDRDDRPARPRGRASTARPRVGLNDVSFTRRPHDRVAELSYRIAGEEVGQRPLRRARRRHAGRLDRLQPRQPGPDPRLGREGLRGQLHRAALADRAGARRRPGRRPPRRQRRRPRAGRRRGRRRASRRRWRPAPSSRSASSTASARLAQLPGTSFYQRIREKFGHLAV